MIRLEDVLQRVQDEYGQLTGLGPDGLISRQIRSLAEALISEINHQLECVKSRLSDLERP